MNSSNPVSVTEKQRLILEKIIRRSTSPQSLVLRVQIILSLATGIAKKRLARELGIDKNTVKKWCNRWLANYLKLIEIEESNEISHNKYAENIIDIFKDAPRSGAPPTFNAEQVVQIISIACEVLDDTDEAISRWTHKEIAQEAINRNIVDTISSSSVGRFFKRCSDKTT